jgi:hypothetical protein
MISDINIAKQISDMMTTVFSQITESISMVKENCTPEDAAAYKRALGRLLGAIVMDVLEPLYERNPALKPADWDD